MSALLVKELQAKASGLREMAQYFKRHFSGQRGVGHAQVIYRDAARKLDHLIKALDAKTDNPHLGAAGKGGAPPGAAADKILDHDAALRALVAELYQTMCEARMGFAVAGLKAEADQLIPKKLLARARAVGT